MSGEPAEPVTSTQPHRVTGNAVLLLGYIAGAISRWGNEAATYELESIDPHSGSQIFRHVRTGNLYRVTVEQIAGTEFEEAATDGR